ncbi:MAG: mechanosensitive ion channel [Proteobacteria bacterium]|nr:mechanosensitive ion channel [Pseudomonadota bacterium]
MATLIIAWISSYALQRLLSSYIKPHTHSPDLIDFLGSTGKNIIFLLAFTSILHNSGINIHGLIAGLGITGFAFGFALKDALANVVAGVFILLYQPFKIGQHIQVLVSTSIFNEGTVKKIDLRYTTLESEKEFILIPNAILFTNAITIRKCKNN